ncbi:hypothetical protein [Usitatibacter palustris]|uniref:Uncharacterized protein n=1 Tax=Usitatibacter palustris TaxID=2732487 RepID=A0A6M4HAH2_9PROT|nr:hypothetical protein [Usitatibacter palustris]QJR16566.1 hypothetical protein DSM104440_03401 [Usitatibacter palustris]
MNRIALAAVLLLGATVVSAQAPAPAAAASTVAPHTCGKAPQWPGKESSNKERLAFEREFKTWGDCARAYMDKNKAVIAEHQKAVNVVVDEYNSVIDKVKETRDAENKTAK